MNFVQFADAMSQQFTALGKTLNDVIGQYQQVKPFMDHLQYNAQCMAVALWPLTWLVFHDVSLPQSFSAMGCEDWLELAYTSPNSDQLISFNLKNGPN